MHERNELAEAQALITDVRWWINNGKVETATAAIDAYWREWRARRRQRRDDVPDQHASTMQREDGSP
jgi:hypothetical protein